MKADTMDLAQLFARNIQYQVPLFQRPYVWNEEEHWEPLWQDILALHQDQLDGELHPHFLGAVVFEQVRTQTVVVEKRHVIDGQQRLTTLQLLLAAARDVAAEHGAESVAAQLTQLIENAAFVIRDADDRWKLQPTASDQAGFERVITGVDGGDSQVESAARYFRAELRSWLSDVEEDDRPGSLQMLVDVIYRSLMVVVIDLDGGDQAQVIFETLNARGTPLEAADLVKNALFDRARREGAELERLHDDVWTPFLDEFWREEVRQGRLIRSRIDVFVTHYLTMKTGREVKSSQLFNRFRSWMDGTDTGASDLMRDLARYGAIFAQFSDGMPTDEEREFFRNLRTMDTSTVYPYLLWLYGASLETESRLQAIRAIESFLVRRMILRLTPKAYNRHFLTMLSRARQADDPVAETVRFLSESEADSARWPGDDEMLHSLPELRLYGNVRRDRLQMVLTQVNAHRVRTDRFREPIVISGDLTIEHLMPQRWASHWPFEGDADQRARRDRLIQTIGNLTVLTQNLNSHVSNGPWGAKRESILMHSALPINRDLPDEWDEDRILARSRALATAVVEVWPGPASGGQVVATQEANEIGGAAASPPQAPEDRVGNFALVTTNAATESRGGREYLRASWFSEWETTVDGLRIRRHTSQPHQTWSVVPWGEIAGVTDPQLANAVAAATGSDAHNLLESMRRLSPRACEIRDRVGSAGVVLADWAPDTVAEFGDQPNITVLGDHPHA